ncbi:hypothetical protein ASF84_11630 [Pseudomonas sp. Leaf127]|uniref:hypothetical protein n=1 Tax=Pseudomonas TaxID=286 RepID=UPI000703542A|nr:MULTISPECIES: hypothetical protein [Pseudomonas]KQQ56347.1 hypothetical protein ASF84_11630 [Pseudomonas sp. Leaf127]
MKHPIYAALLLTCSVVVMSGCDQVETTGKQMLDTAASSAKQAIDDTHKAATEALEEARQELSVAEPAAKPKESGTQAGQEI